MCRRRFLRSASKTRHPGTRSVIAAGDVNPCQCYTNGRLWGGVNSRSWSGLLAIASEPRCRASLTTRDGLYSIPGKLVAIFQPTETTGSQFHDVSGRWGSSAVIDEGLGVRLDVCQGAGGRDVPPAHAEPRRPDPRAGRGLPQPIGRPGHRGDGRVSPDSPARATPTSRPWSALLAWCRTRPRAARTAELKQIGDFARWLGVSAVGLHLGFVPH